MRPAIANSKCKWLKPVQKRVFEVDQNQRDDQGSFSRAATTWHVCESPSDEEVYYILLEAQM